MVERLFTEIGNCLVGDMSMTDLNRSDLDFLLRQINVGIDYSQLTNALDPSGLREVAGTNNNLVGHGALDNDPATNGAGPNSTWGAADQPFLRLSQPVDRVGFDENGVLSNYTPYGGDVADASPRVISNLVTNSWTDPNGALYNPAAAAAQVTWGGETVLDPSGNDTAFIPNVGALGGSSYNNWFVFFGQFFDHGLDFIKKDGSSGFIDIQILPGDPLFDPAPGARNSMLISRANIGNTDPADFDNGDPATGNLNPGVEPIYLNNTGLLIDQSQTYGSHPTVNAVLREYDANGEPTGRVVTGNTAVLDDADPTNDNLATGLATWADIKTNALRIGLTLQDSDVLDMREIATDATGALVRDPVTGDAVLTGNLTGHALLIDINPAAHPEFGGIIRTEDADGIINDPKVPDFDPAGGFTYDNELLDAHYVVGDGRANENFALTSVHHVWHDEHNFQVENLKQSLTTEAAQIVLTDQAAADEFLAQWKVDTSNAASAWDGEKLFQAARIVTETEYNHVAVDEYVGRLIPDLPEFVSFSTDINLSVSLEFSQSVFRLGHSMLTENLDVVQADGTTIQVPLFDAFLDPQGFAQHGPAGIIEGAIKQLANEVDEFVTPALQQTLVGQPLDLAAINIARGRDIGLPTWNGLRKQIHDGLIEGTANSSNAGALAPYTSWADVGSHLRNPETLVNLVAAYGRDAGLIALREAGDLDGARALASTLMADSLFMEGTPTYNAGTETWTVEGGDLGFWDIDLWVGGLAERPLIEGILGTTFSYVFLDFAQRMQDGDRFYYLFRLPPGSSIGEQIISTKFSDIIARNAPTNDLNGDSFAYADRYFAPTSTTDPASAAYFTADATGNNYYFNAATALIDDADPTSLAQFGHIVISGGDGNDHIIAGDGDDTIHGGDGDDYIQGSQGNDHIFGGAGNDFIIDDENDDFIRGGDGDDTIFAGKGALDTVFGEAGNDEIHGGDGIDELFGGPGDDALFGDGDTDVIIGGKGNDYAHGGDSVDEIWGGDGNDILLGGVGDDHLNGDGGNDLLFGGLGAAANDGDRLLGDALINQAGVFPRQEGGFGEDPPGFDIGSYENVGVAVTADLQTSNQNGTGSTLIDTYAFLEGLVGTRFDDDLTGADDDTTTTNGADNLLVGGAGNDLLTGLGGDDYIAGDWVVVNNNLSFNVVQDKTTAIVDSHGLNRINLNDGLGLGHVLGDNGVEGTADIAVFSGEFTDYTITANADGTVQVVDNRGIDSTTVGDRLKNIETLRFSDGDRNVNQLLNRAPVITGPAVLNDLLVNTIAIVTLADLLQNATDPDNDVLSVQNLVASSGTLVGTGPGTWSFTPAPGDTTDVTFTYDVTDGLATVAQTASMDLVPLVGSTINGTNGADNLVGTPGNDTINGFGGNDVINARAGNDIIDGGNGQDLIRANAGNDIVSGGRGIDTIFGQDGDDIISGNGGNDIIRGGSGDDIIDGGIGNDTIFGQAGNDILNGGFGNDLIRGNAGSDVIDGGNGLDEIRAGSNDDTIVGGRNNDIVFGEGGNDSIRATIGDGNDVYRGNSGTDTYDLSGTSSPATVDLAAGTASSAQTGTDAIFSIENVIGGFGDDTILASNAVNVLSGGVGDDTFAYRSAAQAGNSPASRDHITDFQAGDKIDLSAIDADRIDSGNQSFELILDAPTFTEAGQIIFRFEQQAGVEHTILEGNTDNDNQSEFQIDLTGRIQLTTSDFIGVG